MYSKAMQPFLKSRSIQTLTSKATSTLYDNFGRQHDYLRISLTERCNLRCRYCMPEGGAPLTASYNCLSLPEIVRLSNIFVNQCGVKKIRLTGGEPSIDMKLLPLMDHLAHLKSSTPLYTIGLTTNGLTLDRHIETLKKKGLDVVNISLDTLKPERFEHMTRRKGWDRVFRSIFSALDAGIEIVKINCVIMRGFNDDEVSDFARIAFDYPIEVRFIEFMPFEGNRWEIKKLVPYKSILADLMRSYPSMKRTGISCNNTSKIYKADGMLGSIGFISSMSENFCSGCNRLRLTADGNLKVCLFGPEEVSLRDLLRKGASDSQVVDAITIALKSKKKQHSGSSQLARETSRPMIKIVNKCSSLTNVLCTYHAKASRFYHHQTNVTTVDTTASSRQPMNNISDGFTHVDSRGKINMVDVGQKPSNKRIAIAQGRIHVGHEVLAKIEDNTMKKGEVITVAKFAGIMGAKMTSSLIPLCHQIPLDKIGVDIKSNHKSGELIVTATTQAHYNTGVEMESLTAVSVTLLTLYDMCKSVKKDMRITDIHLLSKTKTS